MPRALRYLWPYRDPAFRQQDPSAMAQYAGASLVILVAIALTLTQLSVRVAPWFWSWWSLSLVGLTLAIVADALRNRHDTVLVQAAYNAGRILFWFGPVIGLLTILGLQ